MKTLILVIAMCSSLYADRIEDALVRNKVPLRFYTLVKAIRLSENGGPGKEFGIMNEKANDYDSQAGWCACTVWKNWLRYTKANNIDVNADITKDYIKFLGARYCPEHLDPLNKNWIPNVTYHWEKLNEN